ncbi:hypothetical protein GCM10010520_54920 [Rhizobium viscosum]|uniref:Uncharacterized protein n=1 Tax=Rhizobium viscosum TaxID=1673 RepID=A0ABR9IZT2_RHIVS|nr:hypothetical protein [Rhizobium viscosum]MBE1508709.1 hypothetical protein [Rhizobium viscosum]
MDAVPKAAPVRVKEILAAMKALAIIIFPPIIAGPWTSYPTADAWNHWRENGLRGFRFKISRDLSLQLKRASFAIFAFTVTPRREDKANFAPEIALRSDG